MSTKVRLSNADRKRFHKAFIVDRIPIQERKKMCAELDLEYKNAYMMAYHYHKQLKKKSVTKTVKETAGKVEVTHFTKSHPLTERATVTIGNAKVEIPGRSVSIGGVKLEW